MEIRTARPEDAAAACAVLRRSIAELCVADHHGDKEILARWLANKTPEIVASWILHPANTVLLAVEGGAVLAVGSVTGDGEIQLNYVSPDARFRGVSRAMMRALEAAATATGLTRCTLFSAETDRRFYLAAGYVEIGPPDGKFGTAGGYPMAKSLI
jgi:GNAT superfamily N-acetyltransferase